MTGVVCNVFNDWLELMVGKFCRLCRVPFPERGMIVRIPNPKVRRLAREWNWGLGGPTRWRRFRGLFWHRRQYRGRR